MDEHISFFAQIKVYFGKCVRIFKNERGWKNLVSAFIITVIISLVTGDEMFHDGSATQKGCFALMCGCLWIGLFNSIQSICRERAIIKREHRSGLRISSYVLAHLAFDALLCLAEAVIVTLVTCIRNGVPIWGHGVLLPAYPELLVDFYLIILAADALGLLVSCVVKNENAAMTVMPFVLILQLVLAGTIFELSGISDTLSNLTISRWGQAALCTTSNVNYLSFLATNSDFEHTVGHLLSLWGTLLGFIAVFTVLGIAFLSLVDKDKR